MAAEPFSSRLSALLQRARQAVRVYTAMERSSGGSAESPNEEKVAHAREWRLCNELLLSRLASVMGVRPITAVAPREVYLILQGFEVESSIYANELSSGQRHLLEVAKGGDFIGAARTARELVSIQARGLAAGAVVNELKVLLAPHAPRLAGIDGEEGGATRSQKGTGNDQVAPEPVRTEHQFIAERVKATMAGRGKHVDSTRTGGGSEECGDSKQGARKIVPLRRMTAEG
jgi:hypothetical protein